MTFDLAINGQDKDDHNSEKRQKKCFENEAIKKTGENKKVIKVRIMLKMRGYMWQINDSESGNEEQIEMKVKVRQVNIKVKIHKGKMKVKM